MSLSKIFIFAMVISIIYMEYLDFEIPIKEAREQYNKCQLLGKESGVNVEETCKQLENKLEKTIKDIYSALTPWQRVEVSRHVNRPHTLDYIKALTGDTFMEFFGDRAFGDDKAMVGGFGKIENQSFMLIGQQKGRNTKERQYRRFGMPNPEGYRKALRLMKMAEKFNIPIITFIDTPGAYPGLEAEKRGQGEAIARNLFEISLLKVPIICIVIGEGASGGALGIGVGDKTFMLENTWYSVISPESCSSILWRSWEHKKEAAKALKLTSYDMKKNQLIDDIIKEPLGGAHTDPEKTFELVKHVILQSITELKTLSIEELLEHRQDKYSSMGKFKG